MPTRAAENAAAQRLVHRTTVLCQRHYPPLSSSTFHSSGTVRRSHLVALRAVGGRRSRVVFCSGWTESRGQPAEPHFLGSDVVRFRDGPEWGGGAWALWPRLSSPFFPRLSFVAAGENMYTTQQSINHATIGEASSILVVACGSYLLMVAGESAIAKPVTLQVPSLIFRPPLSRSTWDFAEHVGCL